VTDRLALIGSPLRRRHSAVMHNAALEEFGIDARYELLELAPEDLDGFFAAAREPEWLGFQITAPYKQEAARRCDEVEPEAEAIGAVNSVLRREDGALVGFNTDAPGFARSVEADLGRSLEGTAVAVAGAGGAARAVVAACLGRGASRVVVGARSVGSAETLVESFDDQRATAVSLGSAFEDALAEVDLAVNATTVGMIDAGAAFAPETLGSGAAVFDLVYVPPETELLRRAREAGLEAVNGLGMLIGQAEIAFERWTGVADVGPVMRAALERMG